MVRVLHLNLAAGGGVARYGALLGSALLRHPQLETVTVANQQLANDSRIFGRVLRESGAHLLNLQGPRKRVQSLIRLRSMIGQIRPDIIHDSAGSAMWLGTTLLALHCGGLHFVTEHDPTPHFGMGHRYHERLARWLVRQRSDRIIVHGPWCRDQLVGTGTRRERIINHHHGHFGVLESEPRGGQRPPTVLFFGSLRPNKGVELLPEIGRQVRKEVPDVRFHVVGSSKVPPSLRQTGWPAKLRGILETLNGQAEFEVHDRFVADEDVGDVFSAADVMILPYLDATQSGVAMIALPLGLPIVATSVGDIPRVVRNGETGILVPPEAGALASAIVRLLRDDPMRERLGRAAREFAYRECGWDGIAETLARSYALALRHG